MSKAIDSAIELMENGWCINDLKRSRSLGWEDMEAGRDKYCAIGAMAESLGIMSYLPRETSDEYSVVDEYKVYAEFAKTLEAKYLAEEVLNSDWANKGYHLEELTVEFNERKYDEILFEFNDAQHEKYPVIDLFKRASARMKEDAK